MAKITRRTVVKSAVAALAFPTIVPSRVFGQDAPSNMIRIGCIGVGRMGKGDMHQCIGVGMDRNVRVVAVCDVDSNRVNNAKRAVDEVYAKELGDNAPDPCAAYGDYRELLARKDIDGVLITTPEHWHARIAIDAANAGKDSYVEKPLTYSINEGKALVKAVRANKRVLQVGSMQRSSVHFRMGCELVRNGRIGKLHTIIAVIPQDGGKAPTEPMEVPSNLNYDMWMGATAEQPYTEDRVHPQNGYGRPGWLQIERYCLGMITGWGSHMNDIAQWGNGSDDSGLAEVAATAEFPDRGLFDVHTTFSAEGVYPNGVKLIQRSPIEGDKGASVKFIGEEGWIWTARWQVDASDKEILRQKVGDDGVKLYESNNHMGNFLECMRTRKDPVCPVEVGHRSNTICAITHIAMKLGRKLRWDPVAEQFINDDEANKMLDYSHREPWTV